MQECKDACCNAKWCKSFDYDRKNRECDLSECSADQKGGLKTDYPGNPYDFYAIETGIGKHGYFRMQHRGLV